MTIAELFADATATPPAASADTAPVRVHVNHACPILRAGLVSILARHPECVASVDETCPEQCDAPAVVIVDYATGLQAARRLQQMARHAPSVLVLTSRAREWEVRQAVDAGVSGYLLEGCTREELLHCVQLLGRGMRYLSPNALRCVVDSFGRAMLTPREIDVLRVLAHGGSDKLIARELQIGVGTVKSHVRHLLGKLGATARTHAVVVAMERGLLADAPR